MENNFRQLSRGISAAVLAVTLLLMGCSSAAPAPAASSPAAGSPQGGLPQEGIKVHGHWTIEVRNADGTIAEVRDFENALTVGGTKVLSQTLGRTRSTGGWAIVLTGTNSMGAFYRSGGTTPGGMIVENGGLFAPSGEGYFPTLTISVPASGANADKLVLNGTAIAQTAGNVATVSTQVIMLPNNETPSSSYGGTVFSFTATDLATPISLVAGQQVLVTVVISFS